MVQFWPERSGGKERSHLVLVHPRVRARFVVSDGEVAGRLSDEARRFIGLLVRGQRNPCCCAVCQSLRSIVARHADQSKFRWGVRLMRWCDHRSAGLGCEL